MPTFILGKNSLAHLNGVHSDLVDIVKLAITLSPIDFSVVDGLRTLEKQRELVAKGASQTMDSRHLTGHAVDLAAWVGSRLSWELTLQCKIAAAMRHAALELKHPLRWGGCWEPHLTASDDTPEDLVAGYIDHRRSQGRRQFVDSPHFELPRDSYP
jgi:peptidoglycan LD-endopeptidase CwlK